MFRAAAVFSDNMVLQRDTRICVFGEGKSGSRISVTLYKDDASTSGTTICRDDKWMLYLPPLSADTGYVMEITDGDDVIRFENIAIGEVWLAGGQSNMELELQNADGGQELLALGRLQTENVQKAEVETGTDWEMAALLNKIRFYYTPKQAYKGSDFEETERASHW